MATLPMPGDPAPTLTPALLAAVELHRTDITRLVLSGWLPKGVQQRAAPAPPVTTEQAVERERAAYQAEHGKPLDAAAEAALVELYRIDYGVRVVEGKTKIFPAIRTPAFDAVWERIKPVWPRVVAHVNKPVKLIEFRRRPEEMYERAMFPAGEGPLAFPDGVWARHLDDAGHSHPFQWHVPPTFFWWRYAGEAGWRAPWGRWVQSDNRRSAWLPWGHRE